MVICNHTDADYKHACMWGLQRWLQEEFCGRRAGPPVRHGPDRSAIGGGGGRGVPRLQGNGLQGRDDAGQPATVEDYDHPSFDPLWRAAVELELPLGFHILTSRGDGTNAIAASGQRQARIADRRRTPRQMLLKSIQDIIGTSIWAACSSATRR